MFITLPICVAAAVAVGWMFHRLVERHFLNRPTVAPLAPDAPSEAATETLAPFPARTLADLAGGPDQRATISASMSTRGWPAVPTTAIFTVWVPTAPTTSSRRPAGTRSTSCGG